MGRRTVGSQGAMEDLVKAGKLKRVDVLLVHAKRSLIGWIIRFGLKSYWDHVALVYVIRDADHGYDNTFIIESAAHGVDIHNIDCYLARPKKFDVAIKRLEAPWFANDGQGLEIRRRVRGYALNEIDAAYDYELFVRIGQMILGRWILGWLSYLWEGIFRRDRRRVSVTRVTPHKYVCSGFAQLAYFRAVRDCGVHPLDLWQMVVHPDFDPEHPDEDLLRTTTPEDFSQSEHFRWKYLIRDGKVYTFGEDIFKPPKYRWSDF
jgi:hypothetical protein